MGRVIPVLVGLFVVGIGVAIWLHFQHEPGESAKEKQAMRNVLARC